MGTIVSFSPRKVGKSGTHGAIAQSAAVIIFPGVRYERLAALDMGVQAKRPAENAVKRKPAPPHH